MQVVLVLSSDWQQLTELRDSVGDMIRSQLDVVRKETEERFQTELNVLRQETRMALAKVRQAEEKLEQSEHRMAKMESMTEELLNKMSNFQVEVTALVIFLLLYS